MLFNRLKRKHIGAAAVEFALTIPIFILLLLGSLEIGWVLYVENALIDASRLGARMATTQDVDSTAVETAVKDYLNKMLSSTEGVTVVTSPEPAAIGKGAPVTVTVSVPYDNRVSIIPVPIIFNNVILQSQTTMNKEI